MASILMVAPQTVAQPCEPSWTPGFYASVNESGAVTFTSSKVVNAPPGAAVKSGLYVGGDFILQRGLPHRIVNIGRWNGYTWENLDDGVGGHVIAIGLFDDPGAGTPGPHLFAGGLILNPYSNLARWDGQEWADVGGGADARVRAFEVFDDGSGEALYVAGDFTSVNGGQVAANHIARWDGQDWSTLGPGLNGTVRRMAVFDADGSGQPSLYVGGEFSTAGGAPASNVARWDGTDWHAVGSGVDGPVWSMAVHQEPGTVRPVLFVGGGFENAGGAPAPGVARWDGNKLTPVGEGLDGGNVSVLHVYEAPGSAPALYAGGSFDRSGVAITQHLARWNGTRWLPVGGGADSWVRTMAVFDPDGEGPRPSMLHAIGRFTRTGEVRSRRISLWDGREWHPMGQGLSAPVSDLTVHPRGAGRPAQHLYAGGQFQIAGGASARQLARWDGDRWESVGGGVEGSVRVLESFRDGGTAQGWPRLYVAGTVHTAGVVPVNNIASWNGQDWDDVGGGTNGLVQSLDVLDPDGSGREYLYVGGQFTEAGGSPANYVARWNGFVWEPLGDGIGRTSGTPLVNASLAHDDGSGRAVYVGGNFDQAGGHTVYSIARWDGSEWTGLPRLLHVSIQALAAYDPEGSGRDFLYAGGSFDLPGYQGRGIARWDGVEWHPLDQLLGSSDSVSLLRVVKDPRPGSSSDVLLVSGSISRAGGQPTQSSTIIWDGAAWGMLDWRAGRANGLEFFDDLHGGTGDIPMYIGAASGGISSFYISRWGCYEPWACYADCDRSGRLDVFDFLCFQNDFLAGRPYADCDRNGILDFFDFLCFQNEFLAGCR